MSKSKQKSPGYKFDIVDYSLILKLHNVTYQ